MDSKERIIEICRYLDEGEIVCRYCGSINDVEKVNIVFSQTVKGKLTVPAFCPDCDKFIKYLPQAKDIQMPYGKYKGTLIMELDYGYCVWMLQNTTMGKSIKKRFERRIEKVQKHVPAPDVVIPKIQSFRERVRQLKLDFKDNTDGKSPF